MPKYLIEEQIGLYTGFNLFLFFFKSTIKGGENIKTTSKRLLLVFSIFILCIITIGAAAASDDAQEMTTSSIENISDDSVTPEPYSTGDGDESSFDVSQEITINKEILKASPDDEVLGDSDDEEILSAGDVTLEITDAKSTYQTTDSVTLKMGTFSMSSPSDTVTIYLNDNQVATTTYSVITTSGYTLPLTSANNGENTIHCTFTALIYSLTSDSVTVNVKGPTLTLTPSTEKIYLGDKIQITGVLEGASGDITYTFSDGTASLTKASGVSFDYTPQASGTVRVTATSGDLTEHLDLYVIPSIPTYIELVDEVTAMVSGTSITFHPVVYAYDTSSKYSKGTITMYVDGNVVASGVTPDTSKSFGSNLGVGTHTLRIVYSGYDDTDARYKSSSYSVDLVVNGAGTKSYVLYANDVTELYAIVNKNIVFSIGGDHDGGQVKIYKDGSDTGNKFKSTQTYSYTESSVGTHYYTVVNGHDESSRVTIHWIYGFRDTDVEVEVSQNPATLKEAVTIKAVAKYNGAVVSGGEVDLYVDGNEEASADRQVSTSYTPDFVTTYYATGRYTGFLGSDGYYYNPSSNTISFTATNIKASATTVTLNCSSIIHVDDKILITPTVKSGELEITNGIVAIYVNGKNVLNTTSGIGVVFSDTTTVGVNNISAKYLGGSQGEFEYKASSSENVTVTIEKIDVNVSVDVDDVTYPNKPVAVITTSAPGNFTVTINGKKYNLEIKSGTTGTVTYDADIAAGENYAASVEYIENYKYNSNSASATFNVLKAGSSVNFDDTSFVYTTPVSVTVTTVNSTGDVKASLAYANGTPITAGVSVSGNKITITGLKVADYTLTVTTNTDENHTESTLSKSLKITKTSDSGFYVKAEPRVFDYLQSTVLIPTFKYPVTGNVTFTFDDGTPSVTIGVNENYTYTPKYAGKHNVVAVFSGDDNFKSSTRDHVNITVNQLDPNFHLDDGNIYELVYGESVTVHTVVDAKYASLVTGNVTFYFSNGTNKTVKIGESIIYTPYKAGDRLLRAVYTGDRNFYSDEDEFNITVAKADNSGFKANLTPETIDYGESTTVLGQVTNPLATGNVTYILPNGTQITRTVGTPYTYTPQKAGTYYIVVKYSGDDNFKGNDGVELKLTVKKLDAGFATSANTTSIVFENNVKLNSSVADLRATGNVTYTFDDGTTVEADKALSDLIIYTPKTAGKHIVTVRYSGDDNFNEDVKTITINVAKSDNAGFTSVADPETIDFDASTTLISSVTNPKAHGTVTYRFDDGTEIVTRTDISNWNYVYTPKTAGKHIVNVTYSGDDNYNGASLNVTVNVNRIDPGFDAYVNLNTKEYLIPYTIFSRFADSRATGNVTYCLTNGTNVTVKAGESVTFTPTFAGSHSILVKYSGDVNFKNASDVVEFTVTKSDEHGFYVEVNPRTFSYLGNTSLKGTLKNGATGNVTFIFDDGTPSVTVDIGVVYVYTPKYAGNHTITAIYNGDENFNDNTRKINITVNKLDPNFHIDDGGVKDLIYGENVTVRTLVDARYRDIATGNVTFYFSNGTNRTVKLGESIVYTPYKAGDRVLRAVYTGDRNFLEDDDQFTITVAKADNSGFNANLTPEVIDFKDSTVILGNVTNPLAGGNVTYVLPDGTEIVRTVGTSYEYTPDAAGTYHIIVRYSGDENFKGNDGVELTLTVNKINAGFDSSANETVIVYGDTIKLNSSVSDPLATGNVTYRFDDGKPAQSNKALTDIITYIPRSSGYHNITVTYSGDKNFNGDSKVIRIYVAKSDASGFSSIADPETIDFTKSTELISTVTNPNARGNVTYRFDDGTEIVVKLSKDNWNYIYTPKTAGKHIVNVTYSGDNNFNGVSLNVTVNVNKIDAGFDAYTIRNSTVYMDSVTLYNRFANSLATGNVTFYLTNGSEVTVNAHESLRFIPTFAGEHTITVKYSGDDNFNEATDVVKFNITKSDNSEFDAFAKPTEFWFEQNTTVNSTVGNGATGNVTYIFDDGTESLTLKVGESFVYVPRTAGEHVINATYNGDDNFNRATVMIKIEVHEIGAGFHINANRTVIVYGNKVLINSTVLDLLATGNVTYFFDDGTNRTYRLGEAFEYLPLSAGSHVINATYSGDENFAKENDTLTITVSKSNNAGFNADVNPKTIPFEANATVIGWVSNSDATGNVTYHLPNGTDVKKAVGTSIVVVPQSTGDYHIIVDYSGDNNYNGVTGIELTLKVTPIDAGFGSSANESVIVYGDSVRLNSSVSDPLATGNVTYEFDDGTVFESDKALSDIIIYTPKSAGTHTVTVRYSGDKNFNPDTKQITINVAKSDKSGFGAQANPDEIPYLDETTLNAFVTNPDATGTVTYRFDDGTVIQTTTEEDWSYVYRPLSAGLHTVNVTYNGNDNFNKASVNVTVNVTKIDPGFDGYTIRDTIIYLDNLTVYHRFAQSGVTGNITVTFCNGTNKTINVNELVKFMPLYAGTHTMNLTYNGDVNFNKATDSITYTVKKSDEHGFYVEVNPRTFSYLDSTSLKGTLKNGATGNVIFIFDDGTPSVTVDIGVVYVYTPKYAGNHTITAIYNGDENFNDNTRKINITVNKLDPNFHIDDGGVKDLIYGENVTVRTLVDARYRDIATGNVTFYFSNGTNRTVKLGESIVYTPYKAGDRVLRAVYTGDRNFLEDDDQFTIEVKKSDKSGFSANLTPDVIDFKDSTVILGNVTNPLAGGNVTYVLPDGTQIVRTVGTPYEYTPDAAGTYHIIVKYSGDENFKGNDGVELTLKVERIDAGFDSLANMTEVVFENAVKLNSSVSDPLATGNVTYTFDDGTPAETNKALSDIIIYTPKTSGEHKITVKYSGDTNFKDSTKVITVNVLKSDDAGFDCVAEPDEFDFKKSTTLISTVSNSKARGNVTYRFDDGTEIVIRLDKDNWNYVYTPKTAGKHIVNVTYSGDENFKGTSINVTLTVNKIDSGFDGYTIRDTIIYLDNLTVYHSFAQEDVTGNITVTFCNGTNKTVNVNELVKFMPLYAGTHTMNLTYNGDVNYKNATDSITYTVRKSDDSGFYVVVNPRTFSYQDTTSLMGTLKNGATGNVTFIFDDGTPSVTVDIGVVHVYKPNWAGKHIITAIYNGDDNFNENTRRINITVNKIDAGFHIKVNESEITFEESVLISNVVNNRNATGNVTLFFDDGTNTTIRLNETFVYTPTAGRHVVNATYSGDRNFNSANDFNDLEVIVKKSDNAKFNASADPETIPFENTTVLNSTLDNPKATGNVTYHFENGTNITVPVGTPVSYTPNSTGTHEIKAVYGGDENFNGDEKIITVTVNPIDAKFNATADNETPVFNEEIHLNSTVNDTLATGNVTYIFDDGTPQVNATIGEVIAYTPKTAGEHTIIVKYSGDKNFNPDEVTITVNVAKAVIDVNVTVINATYPEKGKVIVNASVDGDYNVTVNDKNYTVKVVNGTGNVTVDQLHAKEYPVKVTADIPNYEPVDETSALKVSNGTIEVKVEIPPVNYPENVTVFVNATVDGDYNVTIDGKNYTVTVTNGTGNVTVDKLPAGEYPVNVTANITNYEPVLVTKTAEIANGTLDFNITVVDAPYPGKGKVIIENATVDGDYNVTVNNKLYLVKVVNGTGTADIDLLDVSEYPVNVTCDVENYNTLTKDGVLKITNGTIDVNVTVVDAKYPEQGKVIVNASVDGDYTVSVNGTDYTAHVVDGTGSVTIDKLPVDEYPVKVTVEIPNYNPVDKDDKLVVSNGTIDMNITVKPADYPDNATVIVNSTVDGNYTVEVGNKTYNVTVVNGTGNVTIDQLPAGNYTVNVTSDVPNYEKVTKTEDLTISNGTIDLELTVEPVVYPSNVTAVIKTNVTGEYIVTVDGKEPVVINLEKDVPYELDLGKLPSGSHDVKVISNITNYNRAEDSKVAVVNNGTIDVNVTVTPADYPNNATITVNATVDGEYNVTVGNETYQVKVENGTGNITLPVLPAGNYTVNVTAEIPNYDPVDEPGDNLIISNGTIDLELTVEPAVYPDNVTAVIKANVTGEYIVTVDDGEPIKINVEKDVPYELDLGRLSSGSHDVKVISNIANYNVAEDNKQANVENGTIDVNVTVVDAKYPEQGKVIVNASVDGDYTVSVNGTDYTAHVVDGTGSVTIDKLPVDEYPVKVTAEIPNYNPVEKEDKLVVSNGTIDMNITVVPANYPDNATVIVNSTVDGNYTVEVGNKTYHVTVVNGTGNVTIDQLPAGNYTVNVTSDVPNYDELTKTEDLTISNGTIDLSLTVEPVVYPDNVTAVISTNVTGEYIVTVDGGEPVVINVDKDTPYELDLGKLPVGSHDVKVVSNITNYNTAEDSKTATVKPGKIDMNVTVIDPTYPDNATVIVNSTVDGNYTVTVDNKTYPVEVKNGTGNVTVDKLPEGKHNVTVTSNITNYENTTKTAEINVEPGKLDYNVTVTNPTYPDKAQVTVDSNVDGDYIVEVNNKKYDVKVVNGTGTVEIDQLPAGKYPVKVTSNIPNYEKKTKEATLTVNAQPAVSDNVKIKVTLRDAKGKVLKNKKVTFTYNGKTYTVKTNSKGVATISVKKSEADTNGVINLKKVNGKKVKATIISKFKYSAKFKDKKGKAIAGKKVTFKFNGKKYTAKTNKKGIATVTLKNVKVGSYKIVAKYKKIVHKATINIKG